MTAKEFKEMLTEEDIINILTTGLKSDGYKTDNQGNLIFQTIDHNEEYSGKYKLYYYSETMLFHSYTIGESFDIFELVERAGKARDFYSAYLWLSDFLGLNPYSNDFDEEPPAELTSDWDLLNKYDDYLNVEEEAIKEAKIIPKSLIEYFNPMLPYVWAKEGISIEAMQKYQIRLEAVAEKIIIPHFDIDGNLIGIRGRSYNKLDLEEGKKYSPVYIEGELYNHPLGDNLYGLNFNKEAIKRTKKVVIFEGEKSVLKSQTFYGNNNFTVATCGSTMSNAQVDLLLGLGVTEIIIAFDKENDDFPASAETQDYITKLKSLAAKFSPYVNTYYVLDLYGKLDYKDSPIDKGRETLEFLLERKVLVPSYTSTNISQKGKRKK